MVSWCRSRPNRVADSRRARVVGPCRLIPGISAQCQGRSGTELVRLLALVKNLSPTSKHPENGLPWILCISAAAAGA